MYKVLFASCVFSLTAQAARFDAPDLKLEMELHRRFMKSHGLNADTPVAKASYLEDYRIQSGETLWSLSRILYGDGNYWPRVWAQNQNITNPHLIKPGHKLQFLMGSEDDTPAFRFTEEEDEGGVELAANTNAPVIEIPPPEIPPKPVLKVPASFPEWQSVFRRAPKPIIDDRGIEYKAGKVADRIYLRAFVEEKALEPVGYFLENDTESGLPVVNQYVYIKMKKGSGSVGEKLMIAHDAGEIREVTENFTMETPAYLVQVAGELQITEAVSAEFNRSKDRDNFDCFRALMIRTTGLSLKDMVLIPGSIPVVDLSPSGPQGSVTAQIIGSEKHVASMLFGQGDIVFLNRGSAAGVSNGQVLDVFANRKSRYANTPVEFSPVPSGTVKVVRVTDKLATAIVLSAHDGILQGDKVQEVSTRKGDTEKFDHVEVKAPQGGSIHEDTDDFRLDEQDMENDFDKDLDEL